MSQLLQASPDVAPAPPLRAHLAAEAGELEVFEAVWEELGRSETSEPMRAAATGGRPAQPGDAIELAHGYRDVLECAEQLEARLEHAYGGTESDWETALLPSCGSLVWGRWI